MTAAERHARDVAGRLSAAGHRALFAGGCVRDRLLGREPRDYDVATDATPERVEALFPRTILTGKRFGVVQVVGEGVVTEVATFRAEGGYSDGRRPDQVRYTDEREDALRRDFTINALFLDPRDGEVIDHVGGRADLAARRLRAVGDPARRFAEDHLRMLRAARLATELGFAIDEATAEAARVLAPRVAQVSGERVREELRRLLEAPARSTGVEYLRRLGLLPVVLQEVAALQSVEQPPEFHPEGDVYVHTLLCLEALPRGTSFEVALATLLHDVGKPATFQRADRIRFNGHDKVGAAMAEAICERLRLSREERERVVWLVAKHLVLKDVPGMRAATRKRLLASPYLDDLLTVCRADCMGSHRDVSLVETLERIRAETPPEEVRPEPLVRGRDLMALGLAPGPLFGEILRAVETRQLEGALASPVEALEWVRREFVEGGRKGGAMSERPEDASEP
ncbi:MAG: CCA tRNA nucleotidyltransferase [Planctomycetes bacterium]|nr:CCA tRNA nucleotidyltransferase [Planctomycetota bacterium]